MQIHKIGVSTVKQFTVCSFDQYIRFYIILNGKTPGLTEVLLILYHGHGHFGSICYFKPGFSKKMSKSVRMFS